MSLSKLLKAQKSNLIMTPRFEQYLMKTNGNVKIHNPEVRQWAEKELAADQRDRTRTFSASSAGRCAREQVFMYMAVRGAPRTNTESNFIFIDGTFRHLKWQTLLLDAGILQKVEIPCAIEEYRVTGTIDGLIDDETGWELKGANKRSFSWVMENGPMEKHLGQIITYMKATGIGVWSLVYENKDTSEYKEYVVEWDDAIWEVRKRELDKLNQSVERRVLPEILDDCLNRTGTAYRQCAFASICLDYKGFPGGKGLKIK